MPLYAKNTSADKEQPSLGMHDAVCSFVEDLGTQTINYLSETKNVQQVAILFELDQLLTKGEYAGKPFMVSQKFTLSLHEKSNLSKQLESWFSKKINDETRLKGFDLLTLITRKCTLNLIENDKGYINISNILPPNKDNQVVKVCEKRPQWIDDTIAKSLEKTQGAGFDAGEPLPEYSSQLDTDQNLPF